MFVAFGVAATVMPLGKLSEIAMPLTAPGGFVAGLVIVIVIVDALPPTATLAGEKLFVTVGGA